jgi:hypothetical protein
MPRASLSGNSRSLMTVFVLLAALATSLALLFASTKPAAAQGEATNGATVEETGDDNNSAEACFFCDAIIERSPAVLTFGRVKVNRTKQLDVTVRGVQEGGTAFVPFGGGIDTPTIGGSGAGAFRIVNNGCTNVDLLPQDVCDITIAFRPNHKGGFNATLSIPPKARTSFQGGNTVDLSGLGVKKRR